MGASGSGAARQMRDKDRTHEPMSMSAPQRGRLAVIDARETSMKEPFGRQYYLRRGTREMAPTGPRKGKCAMVRLANVPGVGRNALRVLGPDYLVPKDPDAPEAQRTILHSYGWGEWGSSGRVKPDKAKRAADEAKASKQAKKKR